MTSVPDVLSKGIMAPHRVPSFLWRKVKQKTGYDHWGSRAPAVKAAELRNRIKPYQHEITPIWDRDWDLLVILDACRPEWMDTVQSEYGFINEVDTIHSVGSHSSEWMTSTFDEKYSQKMENTLYVTGNHYADGLEKSSLAGFVTAHDYGNWAYDSASPPASVITDLAVQAARREDWSRCIVHYMQPHKPFMTSDGGRGEVRVKDWSLGYEPYHRHFRGDLSVQDLHEAFTDNLRYVLSEVDVLLDNVDAEKVVLSSDHGQALGEDGLWDHSVGVNHPCVRRVPWVETTATDNQTLKPDTYAPADYDDETVSENLRHLGYR